MRYGKEWRRLSSSLDIIYKVIQRRGTTSTKEKKRSTAGSLKRKLEDEDERDYQVLGPNGLVGSGVNKGRPLASAVFIQTLLPHQSRVIPPLGYWMAKKMTIRLTATPASRPAERM